MENNLTGHEWTRQYSWYFVRKMDRVYQFVTAYVVLDAVVHVQKSALQICMPNLSFAVSNVSYLGDFLETNFLSSSSFSSSSSPSLSLSSFITAFNCGNRFSSFLMLAVAKLLNLLPQLPESWHHRIVTPYSVKHFWHVSKSLTLQTFIVILVFNLSIKQQYSV